MPDPTRDFSPQSIGDLPTQSDPIGSPTIAPAPADQPPTVPGYELLAELGRGGMGVVWKARQVKLNRLVALKMVGDRATDAKGLIRFLAEAEAVAAVKHPNVVQVYEYGEYAGRPYLAMEYLDGGDLKASGRRESAVEDAKLLAKIARGVAAAHEQGIVHRDLKPQNVLLDAAGEPKVTDFGLAKRNVGSDLTATQAIMGTPAYMSPEQAESKAKFVTPAADVWSLGVMLYEQLTGRLPFAGNTAIALLRSVVADDPPRPRSVVSTIPRDIELICLKCLSKEPAERYQTAKELADDLVRFAAGQSVSVRAAGPVELARKWVRRNKVVAGLLSGIAAVLVAGIVGTTIFALREQSEAKRADGEKEEAKKAVKRADDEKDAARASELNSRRLVGRMAVIEGVRLADTTKGNESLAWFARQRGVVPEDAADDLAGDRIAAYRSLGRQPALLTLDDPSLPAGNSMRHGSRELRIENDIGKKVCTARVWDAATGTPVTPPLKHDNMVHSAAFSPDGRRVVTASADKTAQVWDAATGTPGTPPLKHNHIVWSAAFSPDGRRVVTASNDKTARVWDAATGTPGTLPLKHDDWVHSAAFSPDGRRVVTASHDKTARVWDAATGTPGTELLKHASAVRSAAFSPDGRRVVTASNDKTARVWDAATGTPVTPPLKHDSTVHSAAFSPDGRRVVTASADKTARVWDAATGTPVTPPLKHDNMVHSAAFSPDGRRLVTACTDGKARIWDLPTDTRPSADLIKLAHLYASGRIDDGGGFVPLTDAETKEHFDYLKAKYPADFTVTPAQAAAWHREQVADAERDQDWFAVAFHLRVLLTKYAFADVELLRKLHDAEAKLRRPEPLPPPREGR